MRKLATIVALAALSAALPGCRKPSPIADAKVAATNSYLECAVHDMLGPAAPVVGLAEPGTCPGHFDIRPSQVESVRRCRVLLRLDFQKSLDAKVAGDGADLKIVEVGIPGGLCEPASYLAACKQTGDALVAVGLIDRPDAGARLAETTVRVNARAERCLQQARPLKGTPVLCSVHQAAFCRWLGLEVAGTFSGADGASVGQVDQAVQAGQQASVKLVVANLPEGRKTADALADRLGARVVVFGNFPATNAGQPSFDDMLQANTNELMKAAGK